MHAIEWTPEHVAAFQPAVEASPWGPLSTLQSVLHGAHLLEWRQGAQHALIAAKPFASELGSRLEVVAMVSDGDRITSAPFSDALIGFARSHGFNMLAMSTRREHIARGCERAGWVRGGTVMHRWVNHV